MTEPLFLKPYFNPKIWGGRKLETEYGFDIPDGKIGEAWIISGHPHGPATIENGPLKGKTLPRRGMKIPLILVHNIVRSSHCS
uniref:Truncated ManA n=1 Tax=Lacticaseibacillus casei TaxID=1582 RepID=A0A0S1NLA2_LACCA|nr:truncated ManA [Lacticaseibacillus casei]